MPRKPVITILDVGKTNKKIFLFDEAYRIVWQDSCELAQTKDEDGFPCEDLDLMNEWILRVMSRVQQTGDFEIRAINFSAYGASFIHIGQNGEPLTPMYNYLKPFPEKIKKKFYNQYGGEAAFSLQTASPVLGNLNSGMQLYRIKIEKPDLFRKIRYSLHLPQYLSWLMTGRPSSDITSIGCHTNLWNFSQDYYHEWVYREGIIDKLPPIQSSGTVHPLKPAGKPEIVSALIPNGLSGIGLHDSSAAIIPYMESFTEPFILISTGTWNISMNPFNPEPLTAAELQNDCLCYLSFRGRPMKASRLFAGYEHEQQAERIAGYFQQDKNFYHTIRYDPNIIASLMIHSDQFVIDKPAEKMPASVFAQRALSGFTTIEEAYHRLLMDIMVLQQKSTRLVLTGNHTKRIYVDGGFSRSTVFMQLLADAFPETEVLSAGISQASAMGAAMAIHEHWNGRSLPDDIIELKYYEHRHK